MKRRDVNQIAFDTLQQAIGEIPKESAEQRKTDAMAIGRKGGLKGGKARSASLTPERRSEIAKKAAAARWKSKTPPKG